MRMSVEHVVCKFVEVAGRVATDAVDAFCGEKARIDAEYVHKLKLIALQEMTARRKIAKDLKEKEEKVEAIECVVMAPKTEEGARQGDGLSSVVRAAIQNSDNLIKRYRQETLNR